MGGRYTFWEDAMGIAQGAWGLAAVLAVPAAGLWAAWIAVGWTFGSGGLRDAAARADPGLALACAFWAAAAGAGAAKAYGGRTRWGRRAGTVLLGVAAVAFAGAAEMSARTARNLEAAAVVAREADWRTGEWLAKDAASYAGTVPWWVLYAAAFACLAAAARPLWGDPPPEEIGYRS